MNAQLIAAFEIVANDPGVRAAAGGYDPDTGAIAIEVVPERPADSKRIGARIGERVDALAATEDLVQPVDIQFLDSPSWEPDSPLRGGGHMNASGCTSGFTVRHTGSGLRGVAYAAHCALKKGTSNVHSTESYRNHGATSGTTIDYRARANGYAGDLAWYARSGVSTQARFYEDGFVVRAVHSTGTASVGQTLWNYGRATGRKHNKVYRVNQCVKYDGYPEYCNLVAMEQRLNSDGDSGGLWYHGNTAYGIHSGRKSINGTARDLYSPVGGLGNMNLAVLRE